MLSQETESPRTHSQDVLEELKKLLDTRNADQQIGVDGPDSAGEDEASEAEDMSDSDEDEDGDQSDLEYEYGFEMKRHVSVSEWSLSDLE